MRMEQLTYLVEISRHKSMCTASKILHLTPQALSMSMKSLEEELNLPLLLKTPRGVSLTPKGQQLVALSEEFLAGLTELKRDTQPSILRGQVDLYTPAPLIENFLAIPLSKLYKAFPDLIIDVHSLDYETTLEVMLTQHLPYTFYYRCFIDGTEVIQDIPPALSFTPLTQVEYFCCVNQAHPFKKYKEISLEEFATQPLLLHLPSKYIILRILSFAGLSPRIIPSQNTNITNELIRANAGVTFSAFSSHTQTNCIQYPALTAHIPFKEHILGEIGYLLPQGAELNENNQRFLTLLADALHQL